jgi:hypothetical protein
VPCRVRQAEGTSTTWKGRREGMIDHTVQPGGRVTITSNGEWQVRVGDLEPITVVVRTGEAEFPFPTPERVVEEKTDIRQPFLPEPEGGSRLG